MLKSLAHAPTWLKLSHEIDSPRFVGEDFLGVNVATSGDPACDDYVLDRLAELEIKQVRLAFTYCSHNGDAQRLLERLLSADFQVLLTIFPAYEDAAIIHIDPQAQRRWQEFVTRVLEEYGTRIATLEIGNTPNRGKWSGYQHKGYLTAANIAAKIAKGSGVKLAGPNISDFEPFYNVGFLSQLGQLQSVPDIHTDNLFVERVIQPEAYDHRVLRSWATQVLKLNLIKKARIIEQIGRYYGCQETYCTYKCWTRKRLARKNIETEQKHADYLVRYVTLAAACGALDRVYWGPLICHRDGLIDCGDDLYPYIDQVTFYRTVRGTLDQFRITHAFHALKHINALLQNVECAQGISADNGINHFVFKNKAGEEIHIAWCLDRDSVPIADLYDGASLAQASCFDTLGAGLAQAPKIICEQPLVLKWPAQSNAPRPNLDVLRAYDLASVRPLVHRPMLEAYSIAVDSEQWRGAVLVPNNSSEAKAVAQYLPSSLAQLPEQAVLRDKRNRIWNVQIGDANEMVTIKLNRAQGVKKFSYRFLESKGRRHWNNATEMLRRGVDTPQPLAFFERHQNSGIEDNYYLARFIPNAFSCRDLFTAFSAGESAYRGVEKQVYFEKIAGYVAHMHNMNVIHHDLSSGNLLMTLDEQTGLKLYVIDIGRAVIDGNTKVYPRHRFTDLKRICYKLNDTDRELFIEAYNKCLAAPLPANWRWWLQSYDLKHLWKKRIKSLSSKKTGVKATG